MTHATLQNRERRHFNAHACLVGCALPPSFLFKELWTCRAMGTSGIASPFWLKLTGRNLFILPHHSKVFGILHCRIGSFPCKAADVSGRALTTLMCLPTALRFIEITPGFNNSIVWGFCLS